MQLAPQHPLVARFTRHNDPLRAQVDQLIAEQRKAKEVGDIGAIEKHGVNTHHFAVNPYNGETNPHLGGELHPHGLRHGRDYERARAR